jgi:hypothetical protein
MADADEERTRASETHKVGSFAMQENLTTTGMVVIVIVATMAMIFVIYS